MSRGRFKRGDFTGAAQKLADGITASQKAITEGVANPKRSWSQAVLDARNRILARLTEEFQDGGNFQRGVTQAGDAGWKNGMIDYAKKRLADAGTKAKSHWLAWAQQVGPQIVSMAQGLPPRGSYHENKQRSSLMQDASHAMKGKYRKLWRGGGGG